MPFTSIISVADFLIHRTDDWVVIDCRFSLADTGQGRAAYMDGHIPGAHYAHLDEDLSSPVVTGVTGRHPLPSARAFATRMAAWGIRPPTQVIAYDAGPGAIAARLWWLLRYFGHDATAVLDGGFAAWEAAGGSITDEVPTASRAAADRSQPTTGLTADPNELLASGTLLVDARAGERYLGETEPLDPVAGHIPGAHSRPFQENLAADGRFRPAAELRARFESLGPPEKQVHYCGSGVTAAHNLLAMEVAGLRGARMYPGSWSEWITDPTRPVATGPEE